MSKNTTVKNPMKVITGEDTRWSYVNVWEPKSINGGAPKYSVSLIIPTVSYTHLQALIGKTNEVLDNVKQTLPFKDALKEGIELCVLRVFVISVLRFPLHEAVFPGSNRSSFRC